MTTKDGVYGSGLNDDDWGCLHRLMWPFIHARIPADVELPDVPEHLKDHELVQLVKKYRDTGDEVFLDQAGRILVPTDEAFGWYVVLTK